jgi:hypothetical protein
MIGDMVKAVAKCVKCGATMTAGCSCWVKCACGRTKERGAGCARCQSVSFAKVGPSRYEAAIGRAILVTGRMGIHWTYWIRAAPGETLYCGHVFTNTNKAAKALGTAAIFRALDAEAAAAQETKR